MSITSASDGIRVLLVDDSDWLRAVVAEMLRDLPGIAVVGQCTDGAEVPGVTQSVHPDVVLMDIAMPGVSGIDATRRLKAECPDVQVLMLTGSVSPRAVLDSGQAGAAGYLVKDGDAEKLVDAIRTVAAGGSVWPGTST